MLFALHGEQEERRREKRERARGDRERETERKKEREEVKDKNKRLKVFMARIPALRSLAGSAPASRFQNLGCQS